MALCSECGTANAEGVKFCGECGSPLGERRPAREERRVVTVLFADVVGFTTRSESLDIEDVGAFLAPFHRIATEQVERFGGVIAKFIGDGVMALFGAPVAHEDDSERAVLAALAVQQQLETLREERPQLALHVRIGITTGQVLLRFGEDGHVDGVGDAVNTAARLESAAPVDGVLVGARTRSATVGRIEYDEVAPVQAKGKSRPLAAAVARGVLRDASEAPATPFVGRGEEREQLWSRFTDVCDARRAATVVVVGPPGAGKSRLVHELRRRVEQGRHPAWWRKGRSAPFAGGAALWPLAEILKLHSGVLDDDTAAVAIAKLDAAISALIGDRDEADWVVRALRPLLGLGDAGDAPLDGAEMAAAWRAFAHALARSRPTVLLLEDLHWADDATLDLVRGLADGAELPLLVLVTARPELLDRWHDPAAAAVLIDLQPMAGGEVSALAGAVLGGEVSDELCAMLVERAAGNPLFAQEDARMLMESGLLVSRDGRWTFDAWDDLELPDTVQGIIGARLDRLGPDERSLIGDAAVLAAGIGPDALSHISRTPPGFVAERLTRLVRAGLLRPAVDTTVGHGERLAFTHVLIRDCAYERMVRQERAARHERAAEWFELVQDDRDQLLEVVADHYRKALQYRTAAGEDCAPLVARAREPIRDAGRRAAALGAYPTALRLLEQAVELWPQPDADRGAVLLAFGESQLFAGLEGEAALREAVALLALGGEPELLADAEVNLSVLLYHRGDSPGSDAALTSAYEVMREAPPSRTKTTVLGLVARTALERGDGDRALELALEAEAAAAAGDGIPLDVAAYARRQVGLAEIALGDPDGLARISDSIPELERQRLVPAAAAHRSDLAGTLIELGRLDEAAAAVDCLLDSDQPGWARLTEEDVGAIRAAAAYWSGDWRAARAAADLGGVRSSAQAVVPQAWPVALIALAQGDTAEADKLSTEALEVAFADVDVWCRITAALLRARVLVGRDDDEAARLVAEAAELWSRSAVIFGVLVPVAADVYLRLGRPADGARDVAAIRMPSSWQDAALLALSGDPAAAARRYQQIGSLPDAAAAWAHAGRQQEAADIWRQLGATAHLGEVDRAAVD